MQKQQTTESLPYWDGPLSHPFYSHVVKRILDLLLALILILRHFSFSSSGPFRDGTDMPLPGHFHNI